MFKHLPPLKSLRAFEAAARHGSFTRAAQELAITQGAVSYQVRQLESNLGVMLFQRSIRKVNLTPEGASLYRTSHRLMRELEDEILSIKPAPDQLLLTVSVSTYFVTRWLSQRLGKFLNSHPQITLRLQHAVNDPGFTVDEVDLAIKWGAGEWPDVFSEQLIASPMIAVCAPLLIDGKPAPQTLDELRHQTFLHDQDGSDRWREWLQKAGLKDLGDGAGPIIDDPNVRVQSAIDGQGLVLANRLLQSDLDLGLLVKPFDIQLDGYGFYLVYNEASRRREAFRLFRRWLQDEAATFAEITDSKTH